jgi:hypothetical protein
MRHNEKHPSNAESMMHKVFGDMLSGNCYKIKLLMRFLGIPHEWTHVDILVGETHTDQFKRMNPNTRRRISGWAVSLGVECDFELFC